MADAPPARIPGAGWRAARAEDGRALAERLLALTSADEIEREVKDEMSRRFGALLEHDAQVGPVSG